MYSLLSMSGMDQPITPLNKGKTENRNPEWAVNHKPNHSSDKTHIS